MSSHVTGEVTDLERSSTKCLLCLVLLKCLVSIWCFEHNREKREICFVSVTTFPAMRCWCWTSQLLSATAADVLPWCRELGRQRSVIELDTPLVTAEQVAALEKSVNEKIRDRVPVTVRELAADDPEVETVSGGRELMVFVGQE